MSYFTRSWLPHSIKLAAILVNTWRYFCKYTSFRWWLNCQHLPLFAVMSVVPANYAPFPASQQIHRKCVLRRSATPSLVSKPDLSVSSWSGNETTPSPAFPAGYLCRIACYPDGSDQMVASASIRPRVRPLSVHSAGKDGVPGPEDSQDSTSWRS